MPGATHDEQLVNSTEGMRHRAEKLIRQHLDVVTIDRDLPDLTIGAPVKIVPMREGTSSGFWRVPFALPNKKLRGYFDARGLDSPHPRFVRISVPKPELLSAEKTSSLGTLDLSFTDIRNLVRLKFGADANIVDPPVLGYDGSETRVGWKVIVDVHGKEIAASVLPGFVYEL